MTLMIGLLGSPLVDAQDRLASHPSDRQGHKYLLLDSRVIERTSGAHLVLGQVEKDSRNPLFVEDKYWEVRFDNLYANVYYDEGAQIYRAWYSPFIMDEATSNTSSEERKNKPYKPGKREMGICYAESKDGINWQKPELGILDFAGSTAHNIVMRHVHGAGVWCDVHDPDPACRYKVFAKDGVAVSPDGLHWAPFHACPEIEAQGDTHNNAFWWDEKQRYVGITRLWRDGQRIVGRTESADFFTWTKAEEVMRGTPERQTYAMPVFRYANVWLGLVMMFDTRDDVVDCELAWSPDTVNWSRVLPGTSLIPRGEEGSFDSGCVYAAAYPIIRPGEILLYYGGSDGAHTGWRAGGLGLARLRPDGFAGMTTDDASLAGTILTKPVLCTGSNLYVSADAAEGSIRAEVVDGEGMSIGACRAITGDVTNAQVQWADNRDMSAYKGKCVQLRFELNSATLYAFSFAE
ncbi:MAG: hypothetical protein GWP08_11925 [Nitrospiraceae bacterium]|nr:hypothetical protein [Nitrospiraceae bacterium]